MAMNCRRREKEPSIVADHGDQVQCFIEQLYESENLTEALVDEDARILLGWGAGELTQLAGASPEYVDIESVFRELRRIIRTINRLIEQKDDLSETIMLQRLLRLVEQSSQLGQKKSMAKPDS